MRVVSADHRLGYDIASFEEDGSSRHIEVKAASRRGGAVEFYLTENERGQSAALPNYWLYLVFQAESTRPDIRCIPSNALPADALAPVVYRARVSFAPWNLSAFHGAHAAQPLNPPNFLVLDEPTNHLDLETQDMLIEALGDFDGTLVFMSHDRAFLRGLSTHVLELGEGSGSDDPPHLYPGPYVEYVERTGHEAPGVRA